MHEQTKAPMSPARAEAFRKCQAARGSGDVTRAERILCAMLPNVYYARRELEALLGLEPAAIGATLYRDLLRPGYVRKHNFGRRRFRNAVSGRLSCVAFRLTEIGMTKRENAGRGLRRPRNSGRFCCSILPFGSTLKADALTPAERSSVSKTIYFSRQR
jgi:hypothetical protein